MTAPDLLPSGKPRRPLRPLHGIPEPERRGREGIIVSALLHAAIIIALFLPPIIATTLEVDDSPSAGIGPAGGGGGGTGGTGGEDPTPERLKYLHVAPIPVQQAVIPPITPPVIPPPKPPEQVKQPDPVPPQPQPQATEPTPTGPTIPTAGAGGGSGHDGSGGNGPGSGGGVGSGVGTGRGSGTGPGTGGNGGEIFPATLTQLALLPIPIPQKVKPYRMVAVFEVDERGNARLLAFNPSRDSGYNRKIREMLGEIRFRPATRADGTPVRDTVEVKAEAPY